MRGRTSPNLAFKIKLFLIKSLRKVESCISEMGKVFLMVGKVLFMIGKLMGKALSAKHFTTKSIILIDYRFMLIGFMEIYFDKNYNSILFRLKILKNI